MTRTCDLTCVAVAEIQETLFQGFLHLQQTRAETRRETDLVFPGGLVLLAVGHVAGAAVAARLRVAPSARRLRFLQRNARCIWGTTTFSNQHCVLPPHFERTLVLDLKRNGCRTCCAGMAAPCGLCGVRAGGVSALFGMSRLCTGSDDSGSNSFFRLSGVPPLFL